MDDDAWCMRQETWDMTHDTCNIIHETWDMASAVFGDIIRSYLYVRATCQSHDTTWHDIPWHSMTWYDMTRGCYHMICWWCALTSDPLTIKVWLGPNVARIKFRLVFWCPLYRWIGRANRKSHKRHELSLEEDNRVVPDWDIHTEVTSPNSNMEIEMEMDGWMDG